MSEDMERLVRKVYTVWRGGKKAAFSGHPDEEDLALFVDGIMPAGRSTAVKAHLLECSRCAQIAAMSIGLPVSFDLSVPPETLRRIHSIPGDPVAPAFEIVLRLKEKFLEIVSTAGTCIAGKELIPVSALRGRNITGFKDEVTILKDFAGVRVQVRVRVQDGGVCAATVSCFDPATAKPPRELRTAFFKDDIELESYSCGSGSAVFENITPGRYRVTFHSVSQPIASFVMEIQAP